MTYLDRAIKDGYAIITGPENKQKIIYVTSDNHTENYNDPEEKVRAEFWAELIYEYDYPAHRIKVEVTIPDRVPTDRADIVIFSDDECKKPYAVVECKRDGVTDAEFLQAIEQGVGNATWVKLRASYVVIIAGATRRVLDFSDDSTGILERENNIIADLPKAYANGILNNHVAVNPKTDCSLLSDSSEVSFVPMANVQEKTNVVSYDMVAYETVKKGFTVFQRGDLIWAKITPCMQNGKSCIVDKMPTEIGFGSTEFHVIRKRNENVYMPFIWAILSSDDVLKAAQATFSGSAGQQRVSASFIENFPAVLPDYPVQVRLVAELEDKLNLLNGKLQRAYELLHKTPMYLIDRLGLTFDFSATQKITYATTVANIEGRIDADYYSPKFSHFRSQIEALPYRTVSVDDISEKIVSGFAAGKQDQADNLPEDQRVPHLRPFSITPEGELSFETKKYVPKSRLKSEDYCKKNEVIFNNTNSPDLVGKTTVFDSDVLCAASNHMTRITVKEGVNPYYVAAFFNVLLSIGYWKLLCTNFNNQAGVNTDTLKRVKIPLPPKEIQDQIAAELMQRRSQANVLRRQAIKEWADAKAQFEKELLGE